MIVIKRKRCIIYKTTIPVAGNLVVVAAVVGDAIAAAKRKLNKTFTYHGLIISSNLKNDELLLAEFTGNI